MKAKTPIHYSISILDRSPAHQILENIKSKDSEYWSRVSEHNALALFHRAATDVPAYKDFLRKHKIDHHKIKSFKDFQSVPLTDKNNYLRAYPLEKLVWGGNLQKPLVFTSTSGTTGEPFYFPRGSELDRQSSITHELFLKNGLRATDGPTLVIVGFAMGVWIGGLITYRAFEIPATENGYPVSIITPGVHKEEILKALKNLAPHYKQVILSGYPPFVKDLIDEACERGIDLKKLNLRLLFAAESFTEKFREYLVKKARVNNLYLDTLNVYGTADIGTMAFETPVSILIRRLALSNKKLFKCFFADVTKTPTLAQYNPLFTCFESPGGQVVITGNNSMPLVRYSVGDHGGTFSFSEAVSRLKGCGVDLNPEAKRAGIQNYIYQLPFVYVFERADSAIKLHLRDIYPEIFRDVLIHTPFNEYLTGKFTIATKYNRRHDQYLEVNLEQRNDTKITSDFKKLLVKRMLAALAVGTTGPGSSAEFIKRKNLLKLIFWPAEHYLHFKPGVKQKWVKRNQ